ncbi:MAG: enoyl-CoA hydratase/isomerase family protein [Chloroflexota bacterium]
MSEPLILLEKVGRVARLTLNNPDKRNAMNYAMVNALIAALRQADADPEVRAVVVAGAGDHFSAGGDLKEFAQELDLSAFEHWQAAEPWIELFQLAPAMRVPLIAAVQGYALAGGCGLVALCDLAVAAEDATLGTTEIRIGLFPMIIFPALRRAVGERKALEMALTGRMVEAEEARRMGLVNQVTPRAELLETAMELAASIARKGPAAVTMGKRLFYATADMGYDEALEFARNIRVAYMLADDVAEGVDAFLNKRQPNWG